MNETINQLKKLNEEMNEWMNDDEWTNGWVNDRWMDETTLSGPMMWPDWMIATNREYTEKRVDL